MLRSLAVLATCLVLSGCDEDIFGHGCTEIGCGDSLSVALRTADDRWSDGEYVIELNADEQRYTCALRVPEDLPSDGQYSFELPCEPSTYVTLRAETECTEQRTGDAVSQSCQPIEDQWRIEASLDGTPAELRVKVTRDGQTLLEDTMAPEYTATRPNGPDCEPVCNQANAELVISR